MVDEAHERSLATDTLLGLLKKVQKRRPELRLIISSATLEVEKLRAFFDTSTSRGPAAAAGGGGNAPSRAPAVIAVEGRQHPVQVGLLQPSGHSEWGVQMQQGNVVCIVSGVYKCNKAMWFA